MDSSRFDKLTKALATPTSRRQALKTIAVTTIGSILGLGGIGSAFAKPKCHRNGTGCDTNSQCCSGYCANGEKCTCPPAPACNSICPCPSGQICQNGQCVCVSPPPPGPDHLVCNCNDGTTINICATLDCFSGPAQGAICGPACQCHGGQFASGCLSGGCG